MPDDGTLPRRLAVLAFADIVGWSVLTAADENRAAERWTALFRAEVAPGAARLGGRIVDVQGDGTLAEFSDAAAALSWARALHAAADAHSAAEADAPPLTFRVAIHLGPVLVDGERLLGEAVNLAARLQEYGTPGGTLLSAEAAALLPAADLAGARDLGDLPLRNMARSVRALSLDPPRGVAVPLPPPPTALPSIAVLPLANQGGDPTDDYVAAGVVEDVVASLAALHEVFVIAPESARMFAGQSPTPQRVGRTLGVRWVVMGGLRRVAGGFRASVRLLDTATGEQVWSERIEAADRELFAVQEHLAGRILAGVAPSIRAAALREAMRKRPESLSAYDHMLRGVHAMSSTEADEFLGARHHFARSMEIDPGFAPPRAWAAYWHNIRMARGLPPDGAEDGARLFRLCEEAIALDPSNSMALGVLGHNLSFVRREYDQALQHFDAALAASPGNAMALTFFGATLAYVGRGEEAVARAQRGIRLSPYDPMRFYQQLVLGIGHYIAGDLGNAEKACRMALSANTRHAPSWRMLGAVLGGMGRAGEAREAGRRLLQIDPGFRLGRYAEERNPFGGGNRERFMKDLAVTGLPH